MANKVSVAEYHEAITQSHGILAAAARRLKVSRTAVYKATKRHPTLKTVLDDARAEVLDLAESRLFEAVNAGNLTAVIYLLSTLGKDRGYVTRQEIQPPAVTARQLEEMSDEELAQYAESLGI